MRDSEIFIYGLLFLAIIGFQVFRQFLAARAEQRRRREAQARAATSAQPDRPREDPEPLALAGTDWGRPPEPKPPLAALPLELPGAVETIPAPARQAPSGGLARQASATVPGRARHRLFHSRRALRHGIVMMTVLGPCRAVQPYEPDK